MCLYTFETKAKIAEKDITVYKKVQTVKEYKHIWEAPFRGTVHSFNKILKGTDKLCFISSRIGCWDTGLQRINEGFHAYTVSFQEQYEINEDNTFFVKAIIPKGSEYVEGDEIISSKQIVANNMIVFSSNWQYFLWKLGFKKGLNKLKL